MPHTPVEVGLWVQKYAAQIERSPVMTMCTVHGVTPPAKLSKEELKAKEQPFWPNQLFIDMLAIMKSFRSTSPR